MSQSSIQLANTNDVAPIIHVNVHSPHVNEASVKLHERLGFKCLGEVNRGIKLGNDDVIFGVYVGDL